MRKSVLVLCAIITSVVSASRADVLVNEDFSSASTSSYITSYSGSIWTATSTYGSNYNVSGSAIESPFTAKTTTRSAVLGDANLTGGIGMGAKTTHADQTGIVHYAFDYYIDSQSLVDAAAGTINFSPTVIMGNATTGGLFLQLSNYNSTDGKYYLTNQRDSNGSSVITEVQLKTWYHIDIIANAAISKYTLSVTPFGGQTLSPSTTYSFRNNITTLNTFTFTENNGVAAKGQYYFDNLLIETIPEPAALGFITFGLLAAFRRR